MSDAPRIFIIAVGARTAVGTNAATTAAAVRARVCRIGGHPHLVDRAYRPYMTAEAKWLGDLADCGARMCALARPAAAEALAGLSVGGARPGVRLHVFIGLPTPRAGLARVPVEHLGDDLRAGAKPTADLVSLHSFYDDHAGGVCALSAAVEHLNTHRTDVCLVGGVDSLLALDTLDALQAEGRLFTADNPRGLVPGEAAAFCLVLTEQGCIRLRLPPLAELDGLGLASESVPLGRPAVCTGAGLSRAFTDALATLGSARVDDLLCDLNGEPYRADELAFALTRTADRFHRPGSSRAPADCWGDVGAASGALYLLLAACAWRRGYASGPRTLISTSAAAGARRAVAVVRQPGPGWRYP